MKIQPQRTCMGCNQKKDQNELIRITKNKNGDISIDKDKKQEGRGAYICKDTNCLEKMMKNKKLERIFDMKISEKIYEDLRGVIIDR